MSLFFSWHRHLYFKVHRQEIMGERGGVTCSKGHWLGFEPGPLRTWHVLLTTRPPARLISVICWSPTCLSKESICMHANIKAWMTYVLYRLRRRSSWWRGPSNRHMLWTWSWSCVHALQDKLGHHANTRQQWLKSTAVCPTLFFQYVQRWEQNCSNLHLEVKPIFLQLL